MPGSVRTELCRTEFGLNYAQKLTCALLSILACGLWLHGVGQRAPPGRTRAAAVLPVLLANAALPLLFCRWRDTTTIVLISFNVMWLSSFKAASWALGRGALCCLRHPSPAQFVATYLLPITPALDGSAAAGAPAPIGTPVAAGEGAPTAPPAATVQPPALPSRKGRLADDAGGAARMLRAWLAKLGLMAALVQLLQRPLPGLVESFSFGLALYCLLSLIMDGPAALVIGLTGLRVSPHFDRPWLATSVAGFWSKRWDLAAGNTLRQLVYDVIVDGSLLPPLPGKARRPSAARQALGSLASFGASGLVHEAIFWYLTGSTTGGAWLAFFLLQAPLVAAERLALAALKRRGVLLPAGLRVAATLTLVLSTAQLLFWAPAKRWGLVDSVVGNIAGGARAALQRLGTASAAAR